jgi:hypothetical protein
MKMEKKDYHFTFLVLLWLLLLVLSFKVGDFYSDNSLYAFRALGWFDYIGVGQPGLITWLHKIPWWGILSFQDHPPQVFFLEHLAFLTLGPHLLSIKILNLLFSLGLILVVYFYLNRLKNKKIAFWSAVLLCGSSLFFWTTKNSFLENIESFFIVLSFFTLGEYLFTDNKKYFLLGVLFSGLSLLSKYTSFFVLPAFVFIFFFKNCMEITTKKWLSKNYISILCAIALFLLVLSPVIIYNYKLHDSLGFFDTTFSSLIGAKNIFSRSPSFNFGLGFIELLKSLFSTSSTFFALFFLLSFIYFVYKINKKNSDSFEIYLISFVSFLLLALILAGGTDRLIPILLPFMCITSALFIEEFFYANKVFSALIIFMLIFELFYSINTNLFQKHIGFQRVTFSRIRTDNIGFSGLDEYFEKKLKLGAIKSPTNQNDLNKINDISYFTSQNPIIIYDSRLNWFASWWYIQRYSFYYGIPTILTSNRVKVDSVFKSYYKSNNPRKIYFIVDMDSESMNPDSDSDPYALHTKKIATMLESNHEKSTKIYSGDGKNQFIVYELN